MSTTPDPKNSILACINSCAYKLCAKLNKKFDVELVNDISTEIPDKEDIRYIFTSYISLQKNLKRLKYPPILIESPSIVRLISISYPVIVLDAALHDNGLISFNSINSSILRYLNLEFKPLGKIIFAKAEVVQYGNHSGLAKALNAMLLTLPSFTHTAFLVALTEYLETQDDQFSEFVADNRLVSDENKTQFKELMDELETVEKYLPLLIAKDKKLNALKDKAVKLNLGRCRFLLANFGSRNSKSYMDKENNINLKSTILKEKRAK